MNLTLLLGCISVSHAQYEWKEAKHLQSGNMVLLADRRRLAIASIDVFKVNWLHKLVTLHRGNTGIHVLVWILILSCSHRGLAQIKTTVNVQNPNISAQHRNIVQQVGQSKAQRKEWRKKTRAHLDSLKKAEFSYVYRRELSKYTPETPKELRSAKKQAKQKAKIHSDSMATQYLKNTMGRFDSGSFPSKDAIDRQMDLTKPSTEQATSKAEQALSGELSLPGEADAQLSAPLNNPEALTESPVSSAQLASEMRQIDRRKKMMDRYKKNLPNSDIKEKLIAFANSDSQKTKLQKLQKKYTRMVNTDSLKNSGNEKVASLKGAPWTDRWFVGGGFRIDQLSEETGFQASFGPNIGYRFSQNCWTGLTYSYGIRMAAREGVNELPPMDHNVFRGYVQKRVFRSIIAHVEIEQDVYSGKGVSANLGLGKQINYGGIVGTILIVAPAHSPLRDLTFRYSMHTSVGSLFKQKNDDVQD